MSAWRDKFEWSSLDTTEILARQMLQKWSLMVEEHGSWVDAALTQDEISYIYNMLDKDWRDKYKELFKEVVNYVEETQSD